MFFEFDHSIKNHKMVTLLTGLKFRSTPVILVNKMQHLLTFIILLFVFHSKSTILYLLQNVVDAECRRCRMWWVSVNWCVYDESMKINDHYASMVSRWCVGDESVMSRWWVGDESLDIDDHDASMMSWWWIGNESVDELVKINDESVISWWKS